MWSILSQVSRGEKAELLESGVTGRRNWGVLVFTMAEMGCTIKCNVKSFYDLGIKTESNLPV